MLYPPIENESKKPVVSLWHRDIRDVLFNQAGNVPKRELAAYNIQLSYLLGAGITFAQALLILSAQTRGRILKRVLPDLHTKISQGESPAQAMRAAGVFPLFMCGLIAIGETTAQLPRVCGQLADFYEQQARNEEELRAALVYPVAVTVMMLGVITMAVVVVLPGYANIFEASGVQMPVLTRWLMAAAIFITENTLPLGVGLFALLVGGLFFIKGKAGQRFVSAVQLRFSFFKRGINFRLLQSLSLMLDAGQPISRAIPLCAEVINNVYVKEDLTHLAASMAAGRPFWSSLSELKYIDETFVSMARVGEEAGHLPKTIHQCMQYTQQEYKKALGRMNKLMEPIITLVLGVLLAIVMLAIVLPTFELATVI